MYADRVTDSMQKAIDETNRRRKIQMEYNLAHQITPESVRRAIDSLEETVYGGDYSTVSIVQEEQAAYGTKTDARSPEELIIQLEEQMKKAASRLEFEDAARIRDQIRQIKKGIRD
jgi:excinuclease ABC subunit B